MQKVSFIHSSFIQNKLILYYVQECGCRYENKDNNGKQKQEQTYVSH